MKTTKINYHNAPAFVKHLQNLAGISKEENPGIYAFGIYDQLRKLEKQASRVTTALCNGEIEDEAAERKLDKIEAKVKALINVDTLFINRDPRGYALKIKEDEAKRLTIYQDWGGYGILAPEF